MENYTVTDLQQSFFITETECKLLKKFSADARYLKDIRNLLKKKNPDFLLKFSEPVQAMKCC